MENLEETLVCSQQSVPLLFPRQVCLSSVPKIITYIFVINPYIFASL